MWDRLTQMGWQEGCFTDVLHNLLDAIAAVPRFAWQRRLVSRAPEHGGVVYVMAHRGAHLGIPENTLPAYREAIDLGVDFVEIDVGETADGHFVICDDDAIGPYEPGSSPAPKHEGKIAGILGSAVLHFLEESRNDYREIPSRHQTQRSGEVRTSTCSDFGHEHGPGSKVGLQA